MRELNPENFPWFGPELERSQEAMSRKGDFWFGKDVITERGIILPGLATMINLKLKRENLPDIDELTSSTLHLLRTSTRSCYAQVGADFKPDISRLTEEDIQRIKAGEEVDCPALALNHSRRAIEIKDGLFRYFWTNPEKHLTGDKLKEAVGQMKIEGEEGKDWFLGRVGDEPSELAEGMIDKEMPITLALRIKDKKLWIPFPATEQPVKVNSKRDLPKYLEQVPDGLTPDFMICETVPVTLPDNLVGVINTGVHDKGGMHSGSPLIDPGFRGPIRLEIINFKGYSDFVEFLMYEHNPQKNLPANKKLL